MDRPLEIAFHNMQSSAWVEAEIRTQVQKLEKRFGRMTGCRVSVEALHNQHRTGNIYEVHITLSLPGTDLAISREPHRARERFANPDLRTVMRDAFRSAERRLESFKGRLREDTSKPSGSALAGQVAQLLPEADHGFILTATGTQLYFHRDSVTNGAFDKLAVGDPIHYVEEEGDAGPVATKVRVVEREA